MMKKKIKKVIGSIVVVVLVISFAALFIMGGGMVGCVVFAATYRCNTLVRSAEPSQLTVGAKGKD